MSRSDPVVTACDGTSSSTFIQFTFCGLQNTRTNTHTPTHTCTPHQRHTHLTHMHPHTPNTHAPHTPTHMWTHTNTDTNTHKIICSLPDTHINKCTTAM